MKKNQTVKRRIFISNTLMVLITLCIFLMINIVFLKLYFRFVEQKMIISAERTISANALEDLIEDWVIHNNSFFLLFLIDGAVCIIVLIIISQLFTKNLTNHIMEPLQILSEATQRIKNNDLTCSIEYMGDREFEEICYTFNEMQRHLLTARERNQKYEKARTDMIAGVSHDLRTPLTAIKGAVKSILDGIAAKPEQKIDLLQIAYRRTEDMDILLNQLFYLSKLETGNMPIQCNTVDILEYLQTYANAAQSILDIESEELIVEENNAQIEVSIDIEQFHRILDNLLENSRKYADKVPLKMRITLNQLEDFADICFSDNGIGVSQEKLASVFDEFYRGDESRNTKEGNGLGLYIVKCLIECMGGYVRAENANGFKVHLILPIIRKGRNDDEKQKINFNH